jgi:hypothetical protein
MSDELLKLNKDASIERYNYYKELIEKQKSE